MFCPLGCEHMLEDSNAFLHIFLCCSFFLCVTVISSSTAFWEDLWRLLPISAAKTFLLSLPPTTGKNSEGGKGA